MKSKTSSLISLVFSILTLISMLVLTSPSTSAEDVIDDVAITVPSACSFTSSTQDATFTRTLTNNHYESGIGTNTFTVACNDIAGFSIYAIGYSGEEYGNTNMLPSTSGLPAIATGTATSGNTSAWAMRLTPVSGTYAPTIQSDTNGSFANYHIVPSTYAKVATFTQIVDGSVGSSMTSDYAVFISSTQPAGTYTGKVKYTLVHPNDAPTPTAPVVTDPGYISYNPNAPGVTDSMGDQAIEASDTSAELWASNFQRSGYGFAGWSETFDYSDSTKFHGPNETIEFTAGQYSGDNNGLSLYAIWVPSAGDLQNWTGCSSLAQGAVTALTDQRDNNTYAVAKLADGACWMIENLRLNDTNSDNSAGALAQGYNSSFIGLATPETANFDSNGVSNSLYSTDGSTMAIISGNDTSFRFPRYNNQNTASPVSNMTDTDSNVYSYGNWYTWHAAIADTTRYINGNMTTSICPTGWRLPYGRNTSNGNTPGGFYYLNYKINNDQNITDATASNGLRAYPNNFIYSGGFNSSSPVNRGSYGNYWSSTPYDYAQTYNLSLNSSIVSPGTIRITKGVGRSIRCLIP